MGQGIGTAGTIVADFSSAKGSGGFHLSSTNANGLTSTTDGTLTESDDEVAISSAGAIYGLTSTGWALASGAGNSLGIGDYRESSIATGTYAYPVPGGSMIGATSATSHDTSRYDVSTLALVVAGAWQTSGSATTTDSGDTTDSYSGSGSFTNSSSADDGSQTATVTGNISEGGYEESNYFQRAEFFLDNANWVFSSGHGTGGGSGASNATVSQTGHYFNSFADGNITGTTRSNSTSSDGYSYGSTTDSLNVNGTIVDSGTSNSTSWGNSTANAFDSGDYYRNFTATDGTNFVTGGNVTVKSSDRMTYDSGTTSVLLDGVWVQVSGNGTTTGDGDSSNIRSEAGDYTKPLTGGQITGRVGEESSQKSAYDFRIDSTFASGNWSDSGYQNTSGSSFYNSNYSGSGSTVVVSNITNNGTSTITSNVVEDGFDTSNGSWASRSELNPATGWTLASGNEKYRGSGGSNLTSNGSGSYTFPVPGGNVSGNTAQSSGDYSSYSFEITANVVSGVWVATGTRNETFNAYSSSKSSGQGNSTTADSIEANNTATVHRAWSHNSTENSSMSGFANSSWLDGAWSLSGGTSNSSGNGSSHLESNGTGNYSRAVDGCGTLSGNLTVFSSNDSTWNSNSKGNVANGIWVYSGSSSDSANSTTNRTLNGTGQYAFNNETFTQNGTVTEYTFDSETSDTSGTGNQSSDGTWAQASGDSLATSCGISQLTYTNSVIVRNANLTVGNNTFTGNRTDSMAFGTDYSSRVSSRFENGTWSTPNGTGNAGEFIIIKSNIAGEYSDNTTVHGFAISGTATFDYTASSKDSIVRHYSLDANGSWTRAGNNTYHGDIDVTFDRLYVRENVPYTRTPCITEVSGSGTINGNISVVHKHVIKFHGDLTYNTTGPDRIVTTGSAYFTDTDEYHSGYEGNGTWSRPGADGLPFTGTMSESGNSDHSFAYRFDYQFQPGDLFQSDTWKLTGGTANVTQTVTARFDADASHTSVTVDDSTETSSQGVAIYYVGFNLADSQSTSFNDTGDSSGSLTTVTRHSTTTVTEEESFHIRASTRLTQNGTLVKDSDNTWGWNTTGNATSTTSGDWLLGTTTGFNGTATTVWSKNDASLTTTSTLDSQSGDVKRGEWQADNTFEFIDGLWTQTGSNLTTKVNYDQFANACGTSNLTATGESVSLSMSASRTDDSTLSAYYRHTVTNSGDVTVWGHNSTSTVDWTTSANLTVNSPCSTSSEFFNSNFSDSLTTNSTWSQTNNGPIVGSNDATYTLASNYSGGSSNDYGGSYAYSGGQNWTWSDPNLSTYNARALSEIRITPAGPPDVGPATFRSAPSPSFVMPPALVEDPEATAAAEQQQSWEEWLVDQGIGLIPIVGSGRDAYRAYMAGNNIGLAFNLGMLVVDVLTLGSGTAAKAVGKSTIRAGKKTMAVAKSVIKSSTDDTVKLVGKNVDNVGKGLIDDVAGGAKQIKEATTETNFIIVQSGQSPRKVRVLSNSSSNPKWGLTPEHLKKHFFGDSSTALKQIDPGGTSDKWSQHLAILLHSPVTSKTSNGMLDIIHWFPRADGSGLFKMGVRLSPNADGTFDLITVLTRQ